MYLYNFVGKEQVNYDILILCNKEPSEGIAPKRRKLEVEEMFLDRLKE